MTTEAQVAQEMFNTLVPYADQAWEQYILTRTPYPLQDEMVVLIDAGSPDAPVVHPLFVTEVAQAQSYNVAGDLVLAVSGITANIGELLILAVGADNAGAAGITSTTAAITDASGNVWTRIYSGVQTLGVANDGATLSIFTCPVTVAMAGASINVNFSPATPAKAAIVKKVSTFPGQTITVKTVGPGAVNTSSTINPGSHSVLAGETSIGFGVAEYNVAPTPDVDTLGGTWSPLQISISNSGTLATSMLVESQHKTSTIEANQIWNTPMGVARKWCSNYLILATARA